MRIQKLSHCCLVIDVNDKRILLDPGFYSIEEHDKLSGIDIVLITHEHADHFHIESLKALIKRCPDIVVITNDSVGAILAKEGVEHRIMIHGNSVDVKGIHIDAYGTDHAVIHSSIPLFSNVGFFINDQFFFPGDALTDPKRQIDILALPVAGPWIKISEAIDYALALKPKMAFPVHDAVRIPTTHMVPEKVLGTNGIEFIKLEEGGVIER